ncbi:hypothetical protein [Gymnodinialimonas sp.]
MKTENSAVIADEHAKKPPYEAPKLEELKASDTSTAVFAGGEAFVNGTS